MCLYHLYIHLLFAVISFQQTYNINGLKWCVRDILSYFICTISDFLRTHNFVYVNIVLMTNIKLLLLLFSYLSCFLICNWLQFFGICIDVTDVNRVNHKCNIFHITNLPGKFFLFLLLLLIFFSFRFSWNRPFWQL